MQTKYKELQRGRVLAGARTSEPHWHPEGGGAALKSCLRDGVGLAGAQRKRAGEGEAEGVGTGLNSTRRFTSMGYLKV